MPKILVIEDELPVRVNLVAMLKAEGFQVISAEDGQAGVQIAQAHLPDLIICDITMPKLDGFGVLEALQQNSAVSMVPFIFLSAKSERSDFRRGMNLGADDYLTKPFTRNELLEAVCTRLTKHAAVMELKQQLDEVQQSNLLKDDLMSTVAHELRSPLATMKMAIELLQITNDNQQRLSYLEVLQSTCNHEVELIENLLDLQRLESNVCVNQLEVVHLPTWIAAIVESFQMRSNQRQQVIEMRLCPTIAAVVINRFGLERILTELLNNACKYTQPGGKIILQVFLSLEPNSASSIESFNSYLQPDLAQFIVAHSSSNVKTPSVNILLSNEAEIPATALPHLFDRFYRVPQGDRWHQGGTGLGLSLVKKFVEQIQGSIQVASKAGWTHFFVQIPTNLDET